MFQPRRRRCRLWCSLPPEIQRQILYSPVLSLCDLAQVAVTCKFFWEVYSERSAVDEAWLVQSTTSAFGDGVTDTLLCWLARQQRKRKSAVTPLHHSEIQMFDLTQGEQLPDEPTLLALRVAGLKTPVQGLLATGKESSVSWLLAGRKQAIVALSGEGLPDILLQISYATQQYLVATIGPSSPAQVVPCLGLVHLACKHIAAAESRKAGLRGWQLPTRELLRKVPPHGGPKEVSPWNNAGTVRVDDQRALSVLHMWNRRSGSGIPRFFVVLSDAPFLLVD
eukprot:jgi/Botrbrau1/21369/Bobra.0449s0001.1